MNFNEKMSFNDYQKFAESVRLSTADESYVLLGLVGEVGELYGYLAKSTRDQYTPDINHIVKELGDITWFVSQLCTDIGIDFETVVNANVAKLSKRKEDGTIQGSGDAR